MKTVIFGTSNLADIVGDIITYDLHGEVAGYVINDAYYKGETENGKRVIPASRMREIYPPDEYNCVFGFMVNDMYVSRENTYKTVKGWGYSFPNIIHPSATVDTKSIGEGNVILHGVVIERHCRLGSMNIIWQNATMPHDNSIGSFNNIAPSVSFSGNSYVGNHCFVGNNSTLKNGVTVKDFGFVGANCFVSEDVESYSVVVPPKSYVLEGKKSTDMGF